MFLGQVTGSEQGEKRRVQVSGKSSCVVALPKRWALEAGLKQGSEVTIARLNRAFLLVNANPGTTMPMGYEVSLEVGPDEAADQVFRRVVSLYTLGFARIRLESVPGAPGWGDWSSLKDMVRRQLIGTEVTEEFGSRLTVEILLSHSEITLEAVTKNLFRSVGSVRRRSRAALLGGKVGREVSASEEMENVERFSTYALRLLNLSFDFRVSPDFRLDNHEAFCHFLVTKSLQGLAAQTAELAQVLQAAGKDLPKQRLSRLASAESRSWALVDGAMLALFKRGNSEAEEVLSGYKTFADTLGDVEESLIGFGPRNLLLASLVVQHCRQAARRAADIAQAVLDMTADGTVKKNIPSREIVAA